MASDSGFLSPQTAETMTAGHIDSFGNLPSHNDLDPSTSSSSSSSSAMLDPLSESFMNTLRNNATASGNAPGLVGSSATSKNPNTNSVNAPLTAQHVGHSPASYSQTASVSSQHPSPNFNAANDAHSFFNSPLTASPPGNLSQQPGGQNFQGPGNVTPGSHVLSTPRNDLSHQRLGGLNGMQTDGIERSDSLHSLTGRMPLSSDPDSSALSALKREDLHEHETPPSGDPNLNEAGESAAEKRQSSRFVYKLMRMVSDPESQHLISFNPSGTSVVVTNFDDFAKEVLPKHFKHSNFSSFIRQLNMYGFYKVNKTPRGQRNSNDSQVWEFSHPKFLRGRPDLLEEIRRKALDTEHARVEARDLRFNVSMGQLQVHQHLEEMQWRLDQTMEQNFQLREFAQGLRDTLANVLEFLKASNGGRLPFEVHLPRGDLVMPSPIPHSPFANSGAWGQPAQPQAQPQMPMVPGPSGNTVQVQPQASQMQQRQPSIFVTEPHSQDVAAQQQQQQQQQPNAVSNMTGQPPSSPHETGGPFSMAGLAHVSPFGSRRVSGASSAGLGDRPDMSSMPPEYLQMAAIGGLPGVFEQENAGAQPMAGPSNTRAQSSPIAGLPRRSMSGRGPVMGLNIQTDGIQTQQSEQDLFGMPNSAARVGSSYGGADFGLNPGLGVMQGHAHSMPASPLFADHIAAAQQQQQMHLNAAVNTPLPPSPAVPGYTGHGPGFGNSSIVGSGSMFANGPGVSPSMLSAPTFTSHQHHTAPNSPISPIDGRFSFSGGDADDSGFLDDGEGEGDSILAPGSQQQRRAKAMRTPLKRTASGHADGLMASGAGAIAFGATPPAGPGSAGKRKSPH